MTNWEKFHLSIQQNALYKEDDPNIEALLRDMATSQIVHVGK